MFRKKVVDAHERIKPFIDQTPILTSKSIDSRVRARLFFKCENFQKAGSFKIRGAAHAFFSLSDEQKKNGVVTHSSGNFAQSISLAANLSKSKAYVVMPKDAPKAKKEAAKSYGGLLIPCEPNLAAREQKAAEIVSSHRATLVHPSNDLSSILGYATATKEFLEQEPGLDYIFVPVGGGGLLAGTAISANIFSTKKCRVIGGEPLGADDAFQSLKYGKIMPNIEVNTIADGLRTQLGDKNFPIIQEYVREIIRVKDQDTLFWMRFLWQRMKIIVEPSSAVAMAAVFQYKENLFDKKIGVILSGGNVDLDHLLW